MKQLIYILLAVLLIGMVYAAEVPTTYSVDGILRNSTTGNLESGSYSITFRLLNSSSVTTYEENNTITSNNGSWHFTSSDVSLEEAKWATKIQVIIDGQTFDPANLSSVQSSRLSELANDTDYFGGQLPAYYLDDTDTTCNATGSCENVVYATNTTWVQDIITSFVNSAFVQALGFYTSAEVDTLGNFSRDVGPNVTHVSNLTQDIAYTQNGSDVNFSSFNGRKQVISNDISNFNNILGQGGDIYIPTGNYSSTAQITIPSNSKITCAGYDAHIINNGFDPLITLGDNVSFSNCRISGSATKHIELGNSDKLVNNWFLNGTGNIYAITKSDNQITGNHFYGNLSGDGYGILLSHDTNFTTITGNTFYNGLRGIYLLEANYNTIGDNVFYGDNAHRGVYIHRGASYNKVSDNIFYESLFHAIAVQCEDSSAEGPARGNSIEGNTIYSSNSASILVSGTLCPPEDTKVSDNKIYDGGGLFIGVNAINTTVHSNKIYSNGGYGISNSGNGTTITDNDIRGNPTVVLFDNGTGTKISNWNGTVYKVQNLNITSDAEICDSTGCIGDAVTTETDPLALKNSSDSTGLNLDDADFEDVLYVRDFINEPEETTGEANYILLGNGGQRMVALMTKNDGVERAIVKLTNNNTANGWIELFVSSNSTNATEGRSGMVINPNGTPQFTELVSCNTIDTDSQGNLFCGTDSSGGASDLNGTDVNFTLVLSSDWTNVTLTETQVTDLQSYILNTTDVDFTDTVINGLLSLYGTSQHLNFYNDSLGASDVTRKWHVEVNPGSNTLEIVESGVSGSRFCMYPGGNVGIGTCQPDSRFHTYENSVETGASAGLTVENDGVGDSVIQFLLTGNQRWVVGADNSDSDKFKIASTADLASSSALEIGSTSLITDFVAIHENGTAVCKSDGTDCMSVYVDSWINQTIDDVATVFNDSQTAYADATFLTTESDPQVGTTTAGFVCRATDDGLGIVCDAGTSEIKSAYNIVNWTGMAEGFVLYEDDNRYGTNADGRIFRAVDNNGLNGAVDGGIDFEFFTSTDNVSLAGLVMRRTSDTTNGTFTWADNTIWHYDSDGSGSGLDADLLDGMDSSAFVQTPATVIRDSNTSWVENIITNAFLIAKGVIFDSNTTNWDKNSADDFDGAWSSLTGGNPVTNATIEITESQISDLTHTVDTTINNTNANLTGLSMGGGNLYDVNCVYYSSGGSRCSAS